MALGFLSREKKESLDKGLEKTKESVFSKLSRAVIGKSKVDEEVLDNLEEILVSSDVGVATTLRIIERIEARVARDKYLNTSELNSILKEEIVALLESNPSGTVPDFSSPLQSVPHIITFRAAAIEQLQIWADRTGVSLVKQQMGSDPASVAYDTVKSAVAGGYDIAIIDTAGRLHNKINLMTELSKIKRVMEKVIPGVPQEVLLVLDGSTGQNAFEQARQFTAATDVTGLCITKLDGTAKGGVVIGISDQFKIPVRYIGIGEKLGDLLVFNPAEFVDSLFSMRK